MQKYPVGIQITLEYMEWGYRISWGAKYPVTLVYYKPAFDFQSFLGCQSDQILLHCMQ